MKNQINFLVKNGCAFLVASMLILITACTKESSESSEKKILSFQFQSLSPVVSGVINEDAKTITATVPDEINKESLVPTIVVSKNATVNPASGVAQNFSNPVNYTVTAEDGSSVVYTVTVLGGTTADSPETISGNITENRVLRNRNNNIDYIISDWISIEGNALLTIEAGTKIVFANTYAGLYVSESAGLKIAGTAQNPVILTGPATNPNKGAWAGVEVGSNRGDNVWEYAIIENAGQDNHAAIHLDIGAQLSMQHCRVSGSLGNGIEVGGSLGQFYANQITACNNYPISADTPDQISTLDSTSLLTGNGFNFIHISSDWPLETDLTLHKASVPYFMERGLATEKVLTIEPGCELDFGALTELNIYETGKLIAEGTAAKPIKFTSQLKESGSWNGINIYSELANSLKYCIVEYAGAGNNKCLLDISFANVSLINCQFNNSKHYGIVLRNFTTVTHSGCTFSNCPDGNVYNADEETTSATLP